MIEVITTIKGIEQLAEKLKGVKVLAYDLETTGLDPKYDKILLISIATDRNTSWVIDITYTGMEGFKPLEPILTNPNILKLGFNWTFDYKMTLGIAKIDTANMFDCMLADQLVTAGLYVPGVKGKQFSLEAVAHRRLGVPMSKEIRNEFIGYQGIGFRKEAYEYAAYDTMLLFPIWEQQVQEIEQHELQAVCDLEMSLIPATSLMELTGVKVDREKLASLVEPFKRYVDTCYRALQDAFIEGGAAERILVTHDGYTAVNPASKPMNRKDKAGNPIYTKGQMLTALEKLGIRPKSLGAKDIVKWDFQNSGRHIELNFSDLVDDEEIADAIEKYGGLSNPILRLYAFYTGAEKLVNTYVIKELERIDPITNRRYGWYKQLGARSTGRYSSDMQQKPKNEKLNRLGLGEYSIRECYIAGDNSVLLIADYSAIEAVIIADRSGDERLAHEHMHGDLHVVVANETLGSVFPIAKELTKKNKKQRPYDIIRDASKIITYGIAYGVQGKALAEQMTIKLASVGLTVTPEQGDAFRDIWLNQTFPQAGAFLQSNAQAAVTLGYVKSALGRKRFFNLEELVQDKWRYLAAQREGSNAPIQSTSADMTKKAMVYIHNKLDKKRARIIISVHDELVIETSKKYADTAAEIMKWGMEQAARDLLPMLGHTVEVEIDQYSFCYNK